MQLDRGQLSHKPKIKTIKKEYEGKLIETTNNFMNY